MMFRKRSTRRNRGYANPTLDRDGRESWLQGFIGDLSTMH